MSETSDAAVLDKWWDSESRKSPFSTVCDPDEDDYCEACDSTIQYDGDDPHGTCNCEETWS